MKKQVHEYFLEMSWKNTHNTHFLVFANKVLYIRFDPYKVLHGLLEKKIPTGFATAAC